MTSVSFVVTLEATALAYREHPAAKAWLSRLREAGLLHGAMLVELLGVHRVADNVRCADELLSLWVRDGVVEPVGEACPTESQQFLGYGGMWWSVMRRRPELHPPCFHLFKPAGNL